ncbi:hypothetical protein L0222_08005 [bacterium]|nr:hypothetical protein [bacterium]MCI0606498.1 hypothetical protein [bacterium]
MRLLHETRMTAENVQKALLYVAEFRLRWREVLPVGRVRELAEDCCDRYRIRSGDSLQLGAALVWCKEHPKGKNFVCFDSGLLEAARQAGFDVHS